VQEAAAVRAQQQLSMLLCTTSSKHSGCHAPSMKQTGQRWPRVLMLHGDLHKKPVHIDWPTEISRRRFVSSAALSSLSQPRRVHAATLEDPGVLDQLLRSSSIVAVNTDSTQKAAP
jgi:hypothetical protein